MKKFVFLATAAAMLAGCSNDSFVGEDNTSPQPTSQEGAIKFSTVSKSITRADHVGADAAKLLNNNFVVEGIKTISGATSSIVEVFDNYNVNWTENTANTTLSNTSNWEYVGQPIIGDSKTAVQEQSIKYWDFAASQYDFWAYSLGGGSATVSTLNHDAALGTSAYTISGSLEDLSKVYISDLQTAYNPNTTGTNSKPVMGDEVKLSFRSLVTKVRIGLYETIPGYSVKYVKFYPSENETATNNAILYASTSTLPAIVSGGSATYKVTFPTTGLAKVNDSDYNKAHVALDGTGNGSSPSVSFGTLTYGAKHHHEKSTGDIWLRINSAQPTWAVQSGASAGDYTTVLPYETGAVLTLKVDYTLESTDGSGEEITVHGAKALIPSQYTQWKPNYAYTYLFKISDNTNGLTNTAINKEGLYPITFDAVVTSVEDGTQETITTVATPSITTYSITSNVTTNNEYKTSDDIYVIASTDGTLMSLTGNATLYTVKKNSSDYAATEAEVLAALTTYKSNDGSTYVGRNNITLTPVSGGLNLTNTEIPLVDGNKITDLTAGQVALIDKNKLTTAGTYAFVYKTGTGTTEDKYEVVTITTGESVAGYYTRTGEGTQSSPYQYTKATDTDTAQAGTTYYDKYTTSKDTYAVKVIKVVAP